MNNKEKNQRSNNLKSYFYNSLFHDIIRYPSGSNIAPHNVIILIIWVYMEEKLIYQ